jgi:hypothetical protein
MLPDAPFRVTEAAKKEILSAVEEYKQLKGKSATPALVWIDAALNKNMFPSHIAVGLYENRSDIADALYLVDGIELGVAMSEKDFNRIKGRTIDQDDNLGLVPV